MTETAQIKESTSASFRLPVFFLIAIVLVGALFAAIELSVAPKSQAATPLVAVDPFAGVEIAAQAAIVIDMQTGKTLYEKQADVQLPLASLTKVPLILAVAEVLPLNRVITIPYYIAGAGGSEQLTKGETWRVEDIIDFTLIASSNTGAEMLAELADSEIHTRYPESPIGSAALWRMNDIVQDLNLQHTYFLNVSGLDLSTTLAGAYGSARDVANLYAYAASSQPSLFTATARNGILLTSTDGNTRSAFNTNNAQGAIPGLIMGKTGTTDLAGGNLVVVFDVGLSHPVVAVVLGSSEKGRFQDIEKLVSSTQKLITVNP